MPTSCTSGAASRISYQERAQSQGGQEVAKAQGSRAG
jgi:hypothetical protein